MGTSDPDTEVSVSKILKSNGIKDAFWALRCFDRKLTLPILADVAESVLYIFEEKYPEDKRPRLAIEACRKFAKGEISEQELKAAAAAAYATYASTDTTDTAYAAYAAYTAADAASAHASFSAYDAADTAADAAAHIDDTASCNAYADADAYAVTIPITVHVDAYAVAAYTAAHAASSHADAARKAQWKKNEKILLKYI